MFESEDGTVVGSIDRAKLDEVEAKSDEAKAQVEQLQAEATAAEEEQAELQESRTPEVEEQPEEDLDALRAEAEAVGVKVDKRFGAERLREEIDAAKAADDEGED